MSQLKLTVYLILALSFSYAKVHGQSNLIREEQQKLLLVKDSISYVNSINRLGMLYHMKDVDSSLYYGMMAKDISIRMKYQKGKADADNVIASVLYIRGMYQESLQLYTHALSEYRIQKDTLNINQVNMNMSNVYLSLGDTVKGLGLLRQLISSGRRDSIMSLVYANYCMGNLSLPDDSVQYYINKTREIASVYKDQRVLTAVKMLTYNLMLNQGRRADVLELLNNTLADTQKYELIDQEIFVLSDYARYYKNQPDSALHYAWRAYHLAKKYGYVLDLVTILNDVLTYTEISGNKDQIINVRKLIQAAMEEENEKLKKFVGDYIKYNTLLSDNAVLNIVNKNNKTKIMLLLVICVVSLFLLLFIYRLYHTSRKYQRELEQLNLKILEQNKTLQVNDEFKNKLLSILAHDFRTPLISTINIAGLMKHNPELTKTEMELFYGDIERQASDMLESFDTILQWIKQQLSGYQCKPIPLVPYDLIVESENILRHQLDAKKVKLSIQLSKDISVITDKEMLQFVNRNLLSNAIKFSPEGGTILIDCTKDEHSITLSVTDEGPGMDKQTLAKLFTVSANFGTSTQGGAGIALSMCKDFIQKLEGNIRADNAPVKGAVFSYTIPLKI